MQGALGSHLELMLAHLLTHALPEDRGTFNRSLGKDEHEFLPAVARHVVDGTHRTAEQRSHLSQNVVAAQVTVLVIDVLEVIEVDHQERELLLESSGAIDFDAQALEQRTTIQKPRERVSGRQFLESPVVRARRFERLGTANRHHRGPDHDLRELSILSAERSLTPFGAEEQNAG